jgi:5-methylthioadenosine/S-adenosylhomocysteine deaminase
MKTLITGGQILESWEDDLRPGSLLIEDGKIAALIDGAPDVDARERIDASGLIVMPGFINAHHHSYGNVLRGTENALPLEAWAPFTVAWGRAVDAEMSRLAILIGAAEMMRSGITAVLDHAPAVRLHETIFAAHLESGLRVGYAPFLQDVHDHNLLGLNIPAKLRAFLEGPGFAPPEYLEEMFRGLATADGEGRVHLMLGPNAPQRCSAEMIALWRTLRDELGLPVHTHLLETRAQAFGTRRIWPQGLIAEMDRHGLLEAPMSVAHAIWLDSAERKLLAQRNIAVSHNPASNLMLGSGLIALRDYLQNGVSVGLGSDSANSGGPADMFGLMRLAMMLPRLTLPDSGAWPVEREVLSMATEGGAGVLGREAELGRLEEGRAADLFLLDPRGARGVAMSPSVEILVQHGNPQSVVATMVAGRWIYRDGKVLAFDEEAVLDRFRDRAAALADRAKGDLAIVRATQAELSKELRRIAPTNGPPWPTT